MEWFRDWFDTDYAALYAHRDAVEAEAAVSTVLRLAPELAHGPVLDVGCGAGRHLAALRRVNALGFGLDLSMPLLSMADRELRPFLIRADMRHPPVRRESLAGVCLWFTSFGYFSHEENCGLLHTLSGLLRRGGVLVMDHLNADVVKDLLVRHETLDRAGMTAVIHRSLVGQRVVKRMALHRGDGSVRRAEESVHLYRPEEVITMAADARLAMRTAVGDYAGRSFNATSPRWIAVFTKVPSSSPAQ